MPRALVRAPNHDRRRSLGWMGVAWMEYFVRHGPGSIMGQPVRMGDEYTGFVVDCYAVDDKPSNNHLLYGSGFMSRPKGCDKSGMAARLSLFEAFGPCRFAGWAEGGEQYEDPWGLGFSYTYAPGEPLGQHVTAPMIRLMATEEGQVGAVFKTIYYNLTERDKCLLAHIPGIDPAKGMVILPFGGDIRVSTASSGAKDGGGETFTVFDETHRYITRELREMYEIVVNNMDKRKLVDGTWYLETTTMFDPSENSVAQSTFAEAEALMEQRKRRGGHRLMYDHRWGECPDLTNEEQLRVAIREAYGEALLWMDEDSLVEAFYDTRRTESNNRRFFLNAQVSTADSWIRREQFEACETVGRRLKPKEAICLGLDGSIREDSTALVAVSMTAPHHVQILGVWEKPEGAKGEDWEVDRDEVDAAVAKAMREFKVLGFFCDVAHWSDSIASWTKEFGAKLTIHASVKRPLNWATNRGLAMVQALQAFEEAILERRVTFGKPSRIDDAREKALVLTLKRHILNARRHESRVGIQIRKEAPKSKKKIDAGVAAVLAYTAVMEGIANGMKDKPLNRYPARRLDKPPGGSFKPPFGRM